MGLTLIPAVQARAKSAAVLADGLHFPVPRPFASRVARHAVTLDGVTGDLYTPGDRAPAIVLIPGAAPQGKDDPRVVRLARAIARAERVVFVPDLLLAKAAFETSDIDRIVRSVRALHELPAVRGRPALLGFSFGGSFALLAAADPRIRSEVAVVATFGSYFDMLGVIQSASTGVSIVGGRRQPWKADPRAKDVLRDVALNFTEPRERPALRAALRGEAPPGRLPPGARAAYDLFTNTDPDRTYPLAARLDSTGRTLLARFSPSAVAGGITATVLAAHSRDDPLVPYGELLRLKAGLPRARTTTVSSFHHVDFERNGDRIRLVRDVLATWWFTGNLLDTQETFLDKG